MFFKVALLSLLPLALASPQYGPAPGPAPAATTSSSSAAPSATSSNQQIVQVAVDATFAFGPSDIQAPAGSIVTFAFPGTLPHSVTQSSFGAPCTPLQGGFDSGLQGNAGETYSINITDASTPIYFFCKFPTHCGLGMVGVINAPSGSANGSFSSFQSAAMAIGAAEPTLSDSGPTTGGVGAIATALPTQGTPSVSGGVAASSSSSPSPTGSSGAAQLTFNAVLGLAGLAAGYALLL